MVDEPTEDLMFENCEKIVAICEENGAIGSLIAESAKDQKEILDIRSNVYTTFMEHIVDSLDTAVPPASSSDILDEYDRIAKKYGTRTPAIGHLADGNYHNFILQVDGKVPSYTDQMRNEMYDAAIRMGGTITAEHGTGRTRKKHMRQQFSEGEIAIMRGIKKAFDPNGIMNPGAIFDLT
jgi:glycolate oxidase